MDIRKKFIEKAIKKLGFTQYTEVQEKLFQKLEKGMILLDVARQVVEKHMPF